MPDAFARAMLDQWNAPERDVQFTMHRAGWLRWLGFPFHARDFFEVRDEEKELLRDALAGKESPRVLDVGCGLGRHLDFLRSDRPDARLVGLEINDLLREHCARQIPAGRFLRTLDDLPTDGTERFDLVLLMGNGLGLFGTEEATRQALQRLHGLLTPGGMLLGEAGNRYAREFTSVRVEIRYQGGRDGPFPWGYASQPWLMRELQALDFELLSITRSSAGPEFFHCLAARRG